MENTHITKGSQFQIPETGKFLIDDWATIIGYEPKTLRSHVKKLGMNVINFQGKLFIDAKSWWDDVQTMGESNES